MTLPTNLEELRDFIVKLDQAKQQGPEALSRFADEVIEAGWQVIAENEVHE